MFLFSLQTVQSHLCRATPHLQSVTIVCENWSHGQCSINTSISNNTKSPPHHTTPHHTTPRYTTPHHNPSIHPSTLTRSLIHTRTHWLELEHNHTKHIQHTKQNKNNNRVYIIVTHIQSPSIFESHQSADNFSVLQQSTYTQSNIDQLIHSFTVLHTQTYIHFLIYKCMNKLTGIGI